jgi:hypothetical protein
MYLSLLSYRYDGLYKVVQYGEEKNKDGFKVRSLV